MKSIEDLRRVAVKTETASGRCERLYRGDLERLADAIETELSERYVALPLDAEGEPIHVGDVMESRGGTVFEVEEISLYSYGWRCDGHGRDKNGYECNAHISPIDLTHHHPPTVEDVLYELTNRLFDDDESSTDKELIAEYAAKLRLAGEDE